MKPILTIILLASLALAQTAPAPAKGGDITGSVKAGTVPLPGVAISAANTLTGQKVFTSTDQAGNFALKVPSNGKWVIRAEMIAFAPGTAEALINAATRTATVNLDMQLASRVEQQQQQAQQMMAQAAQGGAARGFQNLGLNQGEAGAAMGADMPRGGNGADSAPLPAAAALGSDISSESLNIAGNMGRTDGLDMRDRMEDLREQFERGGDGASVQHGPGGGGAIMIRSTGPGGGMPAGGAPMVIMAGPGGMLLGGGGSGRMGRFNPNAPHGTAYWSGSFAALDARPYSLNGFETPKPDYMQHRYGFMVGGPLNIPKLYKGGTKTTYFGGYNGGYIENPFDYFLTVPSAAQRAGDFSALGRPVIDPLTGTPFAGNQIPDARINPAARGLLAFIPEANQPGSVQNFRHTGATNSTAHSANFRINHNFMGGGMPFGMRGGGGQGQRRSLPARAMLSAGFSFHANDADQSSPYPELGGATKLRGWNAPIMFMAGRGRWNNILRLTFNRNEMEITNLFSGKRNIAGELGIGGVAQDPFFWGVPTVSLSTFSTLRDNTASARIDQMFSIAENMSYSRGKHSLRWGGEFRRHQLNLRSGQNARGNFIFTGFATGYDFADFLLGAAQQTSVQYGASRYYLRGNAWNLFVQDDWRLHKNVTLNLGLRYEYQSPFTEKEGRLANLDVTPTFTAADPVIVGDTGQFTGSFPKSLIEPDRNNFAPRLGVAWRAMDKLVVRAGYGVNYNLAAYNSMAQQLALQPPFAFTQTAISTAATPLTFQNGFPPPAPNTITNNYGVDRDYRLGYAQMWNLDVQRDLSRTYLISASYTGTKGTRLDIVRAPNRGPAGLRIPGVQPFLWQSSEGSSILHSGTVRFRKRMSQGLMFSTSYTFSKSIDNASSIGGGASVVAQDDLNLAAERGLSSFDLRHRLNTSYTYELPFGQNKRWLGKEGLAQSIFGEWTLSGNVSIASGNPFTARIIGDPTDVARGTYGTLRADYLGGPIALDDSTAQRFFNTAAFGVPAPGTFGNAGRNTIQGPGSIMVNMSVSKNIQIRDSKGLEVSWQATNLLNHANFQNLDTFVNSPGFGRVTSVGNMRRMTINTRFRF